MPSPFPGMDPYIENQWWKNFHSSFIPVIRDALLPQVRPRYVAVVEEHVYLEQESEEDEVRIPDVSVLEPDAAATVAGSWQEMSGSATAVAPATRTLTLPKRTREAYLTIRERHSKRIVTVIELLSPTNKGGNRREYQSKRAELLESECHLVEIDLLRGGNRLPTDEPLPAGEYYAFVCRQQRLPEIEVYAWLLRHPLPPIPVPLAGDDPDVGIDLQAAFTAVYDHGGFDLLLDYREPLVPPLGGTDAAWARQVLEQSAAAH